MKTMEEILLQGAQCLVEHAKTIKEMNARIDDIEERLLNVEMTIGQHHYTIIG